MNKVLTADLRGGGILLRIGWCPGYFLRNATVRRTCPLLVFRVGDPSIFALNGVITTIAATAAGERYSDEEGDASGNDLHITPNGGMGVPFRS